MKKKIFFGILFLLTLSFIIIQNISFVSSFSGSGSGTSGDPYQITTIEELNETRDNLTASYILMNDLNFTNDSHYTDSGNKAEFTTGEGWIPIPISGFTGIFNGNNKTINNLYINRPSEDYQGLFSYLATGGYIYNLGLEDVNISGDVSVGGLVAYLSGNVNRTYVTGIVNGGGLYTGGFFGFGSGGSIYNSYADVDVISSGSANGGFGYISSGTIIINSYSVGLVDSLLSATSGFTEGGGTITNSFWDNETSGQEISDGGTGKTTAQMKSINTFADTNWSIINVGVEERNDSYVWNIIDGLSYPFLSWSEISQPFISLSSPSNNYFTNTNNINFSGIIIDENSYGVTNVSLYINGVLNQTNSSGLEGEYTFPVSGFSTEDYNWTIEAYDNSDNIYTTDTRDFSVFVFTGSGNGSQNNAYQINSWEELNSIRNNENFAYYELMNNLTSLSSGYDTYVSSSANGGSGWLPIGDGSNRFEGDFNGQGFYINELYINRPSSDYVGLFGYLYTSSLISNLNLEDIDIIGKDYVGGIAGISSTSNITYSSVKGNIKGDSYIGGIAGTSSNLISFSNTNVTVLCESGVSDSQYCGGIVGDGEIIRNSYALGNITGFQYVGGLAGNIMVGNVSNSYSRAYVKSTITSDNLPDSGASYTAGLIGYLGFSDLTNSYSTGFIDVITYGGVSEPLGLIFTSANSNINNSFWDTQTSGTSNSNGGTGKTTTQMKSITTFTDLTSTGLDQSWDFLYNPNNDSQNNEYWNIDSNINNGYPYLLTSSDIFVNLTSPTNNSVSSVIQEFNFSARTSQSGLVNLTFYLWYANGTLFNQTTFEVSGVGNESTLNITFSESGNYFWNVEVYNNQNYSSFYESNHTLIVDINNPAINLFSPSNDSTFASNSVTFVYSSIHSTKTIDTCSLYTNIDGIWNITDTDNSSNNGLNFFNEVMADGTYLWNVWCNTTDGASGFAIENKSFTISIPGEINLGGNGGDIIINPANWSIEVPGGTKLYTISLIKGTRRDLPIIFYNLGEENITLSFSCENVNGSLCQYVDLPNKSITLPDLREVPTEATFSITIPEELEDSQGQFNIVASETSGASRSITVQASIGTQSFFLETISKIPYKSKSGIPYWSILLVSIFFLFPISIAIIKEKTPLRTLWIILIGVVIPFFLVYLF